MHYSRMVSRLSRHVQMGGGRIYVASSAVLRGVKVGWTTECDLGRRLKLLETQFRSPMKFEFVSDRCIMNFLAEQRSHQLLADKAMGMEWFNVSVEDAVEAIARAKADVAGGWKITRPKRVAHASEGLAR